MMSLSDLPLYRMDWDSQDITATLQVFKHKCKLHVSAKGVKPDKEVDYILLFSGEQNLKLYNFWGLDEKSRTSDIIWHHFETHIEAKTNFRLGRIYFHEYKQAKKCSFNDDERNERILDQVSYYQTWKYPMPSLWRYL
ncbi:hypothetical protein JTB14_019653 [Gonioctena quinquepunctata]|nr:hypothetical protein JTB14_019653 [Gonioctena quinquepunctata]